MWRNVYDSLSHLSEDLFGQAIKEFIISLFGHASEHDKRYREKKCMKHTSDAFTWAIGRMFVEKYFDHSAKETAKNMVDELRDAFKEMLTKVDWMDKKSISTAVEKAEAISSHIGYPEFILNNDKLDEMYSLIRVDKKKYFQNWRSVRSFIYHTSMQDLKNDKEEDTSTWGMSPSVVNAFYDPLHNQITFPAAILQMPFYHKSYPKYLNFAGIGFVIGHEITHGFDNSGRKYDKDGKFKVWWSKKVTEKYKERIECYVDQYNNFTIDAIHSHVDGRHTLNENLADNGAIKESFLAYKHYVRDELHGKKEKLLPGFENFTQEQLFFLNVAQPWCMNVADDSYWSRALNDVHSPGKYRILGSLANSDDFSKAFKCKKGSKMNPEHKCKLW